MSQIIDLARRVDRAAQEATAIAQFSEAAGLSVSDAYLIQAASIAERLKRGERRVGIKMGLTSRSKMEQVGVHEMIWGRLTNDMYVEDGGSTSMSRYVHPRAEPEIAFILKKDLAGPVTTAEAAAAVECVAPAIEIIDSRFENFKFDLCDVVADNCSSSGYLMGPARAMDFDIGNLGMVLSIDDQPVAVGSSAAILGHPLRSLAAASKMVAQSGETLKAGDIVLAGAATAAVELKAGMTVSTEIQQLGSLSFKVTE
ncbi:fumarylacetoacetate hydrolase family protein [uncultured Ruegeria sp.]|uniref:2-keto-4-pentenoate hydratase n=1 Tax=uncultured Ruegeria sp. TaxID=259304 RepID=UPI0026373E77|nr:fumarylacetoacetate hydrolase family protein [uncultured Ruegeria sp.]